MKVVVLHQTPEANSGAEEWDVLIQREAVVAALTDQGHEATCLGCSLNLAKTRRRLIQLQPDFVFNLVESLGGTDRLMTLATMLLDSLQLPYTGAGTEAILSTSNKVRAKQHLRNSGLPTPDWWTLGGRLFVEADYQGSKQSIISDSISGIQPVFNTENVNGKWILKPVLEHASLGVDDDAVVEAADPYELATKLIARQQIVGKPLFAERFIDGREFNVSLLSDRCRALAPSRDTQAGFSQCENQMNASQVQVLPLAEIDFSSFPSDKPRIVGHRAKWDPESFEYRETPRQFSFLIDDQALLEDVSAMARRCWQLFGLRGYARIDFRVDNDGQPWILEINANPCLSPDAGFAAAVQHAGLEFGDAIQRIQDDRVDVDICKSPACHLIMGT